jgi:hypothetical protein
MYELYPPCWWDFVQLYIFCIVCSLWNKTQDFIFYWYYTCYPCLLLVSSDQKWLRKYFWCWIKMVQNRMGIARTVRTSYTHCYLSLFMIWKKMFDKEKKFKNMMGIARTVRTSYTHHAEFVWPFFKIDLFCFFSIYNHFGCIEWKITFYLLYLTVTWFTI